MSLRNNEKISRKHLEVSLFCRYFAPAIEEQRAVKTLPESSKIRFSESFLKKVSKKFGRLKNLPYLCTTFALGNVGNNSARAANKVLKNFLKKSFRKIWKIKKLALPLHHFRADKTAEVQKLKERAERLNQIEIVL